MNLEYAGGTTIDGTVITRSGVLARAPMWWRDLAMRNGSPKPPQTKQTKQRKQAPAGPIGWVCGIACAGVSKPCRSASDPIDLPEHFHPDALVMMAQQCNGQKRHVGLLWGHDGHEVTSNSGMDLLLRMVNIHGMPALALDARIRDTKAGRDALEHLRSGALGLSVCFRKSTHYHIDRPGFGKTRVITSAQLDHIALVPGGTQHRAAYQACTAKGERSTGIGPSRAVRDAVLDKARDQIMAQALRMG